MPILDTTVRTISCNGCEKSVVFDVRQQEATINNPENLWLKTSRVVQSSDGRNFLYCSDQCEMKGITTGEHNIPEPKKIIDTGNAAAVAIAAKQAAVAKQAEAAIREGKPANVKLTD